MHRMRPFFVTCVLALGVAGPARSDDWPQYRHDAGHTGASADPLKFPITDIWSFAAAGPCVVARGRVFFVSQGGPHHVLVAADSRTGNLQWQAPLERLGSSSTTSDAFPPAVSPSGVVFITDGRITRPYGTAFLRAFNANTGALVDQHFSGQAVGPAGRTFYIEDVGVGGTEPYYSKGGLLPGPALVVEGVQLTARLDLTSITRWTPGVGSDYSQLWHLPPSRSTKPFHPSFIRPAGYVKSPAGVVMTGNWGKEMRTFFLACHNGDRVRWHYDLPWEAGDLMSEGEKVFARFRSGGETTYASFSAADGALRWTWPGRLPAGAGLGEPEPPRWMSVAANGQLYVAHQAVGIGALDATNGQLRWQQPILGGLLEAASKEHLIVRQSLPARLGRPAVSRLLALRLSDGHVDGEQTVPPTTHEVVLADGFLFLRDATGLHAFAPAERIFRLAVDSNRTELYQPEEAAAAPRPTDYAADATVVRVPWNEPLAESSRKLTERRKLAPGLPLLLQVEWLDPQRAAVLGALAGRPTELPARATFLARCRALAAEYQPEHLDLAPEINVYLARHPEQMDAVRDLLNAAAKEVHAVSGKTRVLLSLNCEVLYGHYGKGTTAPFGKLELTGRQELAPLKTLLSVVDELGLASCPQSAFPSPEDVPRDYFLAVKQALDAKRLIVSNLQLELRQNTPAGQVEQASFLKHLTQNCYWLDAALVACPDLPLSPAHLPTPEVLNKANARPVLPSVAAIDVLDIWRDVLRWERVERLTLSPNLAVPPTGAAPAQ